MSEIRSVQFLPNRRVRIGELEYIHISDYAELEAERDAALEGKEIAEAWFDLVDENYKEADAEVERLQAAIQEIWESKIKFEDGAPIVGYIVNNDALDHARALTEKKP